MSLAIFGSSNFAKRQGCLWSVCLMKSRFIPILLLFMAILLGLGGCAYLAKGFRVAWNGGSVFLKRRKAAEAVA